MRYRRFLPVAAAAAGVWYVRSVHRYRDPVRVPPAELGAVLSPADGVVSFVRRVMSGQIAAEGLNNAVNVQDLLGVGVADGWLLGIYVGLLDVHYTYQPVSGEVGQVKHTGSRNNVALTSAASAAKFLAGQPTDLLLGRGTLENERLTMLTKSAQGDVTVTIVAPAPGLNTTSYLREGDQGRAGYKSAFLGNGGLVLVHVPSDLVPQVSVGDRVQGAQTVLARHLPHKDTR